MLSFLECLTVYTLRVTSCNCEVLFQPNEPNLRISIGITLQFIINIEFPFVISCVIGYINIQALEKILF